MSATEHRPGCDRPGWGLARSYAVPHVVIARCTGCGCVELRRVAR